MTPLAAQLSKQLTLPKKDRHPYWSENIEGLSEVLSHAQFFEVTALQPLWLDMAELLRKNSDDFFSKFFFLPAPLTWLELNANGKKMAFLINENYDMFLIGPDGVADLANVGKTGEIEFTKKTIPSYFTGGLSQEKVKEVLAQIISISIIMINSPQIIVQQKIAPNKGLVRRLQQRFGAKNFPLGNWTKIELKIFKPIEIDDGEPHESHITGKRALHFCRQHIRIRNNKLGYVTGHWRGDAAIGIKQKSYIVRP